MISTIFLLISLVFFLMHACGKVAWEFGTVELHNIGFGLACLVLSMLCGSARPWRKQEP